VITTREGRTIDVVISNTTAYFAAHPEHNELVNGLVHINVGGQSFVRLRMDFVDAASGEPAELEEFYVSVLDIDEGTDDVEGETVWVKNPDAYFHTSDAAFAVNVAEDEEVYVNAMAVGTRADNPNHLSDLTPQQRQRTFMMRYDGRKNISVGFGGEA
jgi:hypothetical protein